MANSFSKLATITASTKRAGYDAGEGKKTAPVENVASLSCTPLDPVDPELRERLALDTPHELLQTFVDAGVDIKPGDILVVATVDYPIRSVADWTWGSSDYKALVVEDLKRA